ncbi:MAG: molybdopterin cofactor-binding domain-containing protein [Spirochaetota bacterium]
MEANVYINNLKVPDMLHGVIVRSAITHGRVESVDIPELSDDFILITADSIPGRNAVDVLSDEIPLLTGTHISYKGQPLLALFGPDPEAVSLFASRIQVTYRETSVEQFPIDSIVMEHNLSWGNTDKLFAEADQTLELAYLTGTQSSRLTTAPGAFVRLEEDKLVVHASTQWPFQLRDAVANVCGFSKKKVIVYQSAYYPTQDEKLLYPTLYACLAALAAIRGGKAARLIDNTPSYRPEMIVTRKTALNKDRAPIAETVDIQVNQGAVSLFSKELLEHVVAGAVPLYGLKACKIKAQILQTPSPPRHHFSGLGSSLAQFSAETHASNLAVRAGMNPANWRIKHIREDAGKTKRGVKVRHALLKNLIEDSMSRADFSRKFAAYEMQKRRQKRLSTFTGYARGIGISTGFGVNGFSSGFAPLRTYVASVTLDVHDHVTIKTSLFLANAGGVWKKIAAASLGVHTNQISIAEGNTGTLPNSGPDVLHRDISVISLLIERCCEAIKNQRFKDPLPITVKRSLKHVQNSSDTNQKTKQAFAHVSWGSAVVELEISPTELSPRVIGVWGAFFCGKIHNRKALLSDIRSEMLQELTLLSASEQGVLTVPTIDVILSEQEDAPTLSPLGAVKGLIDTAYITAVSQAVNHEITMIPAGPQEIFDYLGEQE